MPAPRRFLIGEASRHATRQKVYWANAGLEVDEYDRRAYEIIRKRVFFDDVLALTHSQFYGWFNILCLSLGIAFFALIAFVIMTETRDTGTGIVFFALACPFLIFLILRLLLKVDVVTVYGKRTKAEMFFMFRKGRAKELYQQLAAAIEKSQAELAAQIAAEAQPPLPTEPLPPAPDLAPPLPPT